MFACQYCDKEFKREKTLAVHMCEPKRRHMVQNDRHVRLAFRAYQRFYEKSMNAKRAKTYTEFAKSNYYIAFVRFGKHLIDLNAIDPERFIDFLLQMGVRLDDWCKDTVYEEYVRDLTRKESVDRAVERNVLLMQQWGIETGETWTKFFDKVNTQRAVQLIKTGRISPWIIYGCDGAQTLLDRMNDEQIKMVAEYIDPTYWRKRLIKQADDARWIQSVFDSAGVQ